MDAPKVQQPVPLSIAEFYDGKSVLVTGGMGFLGKVLIEKLLRTCPGIENIYMLCRSKKGKNVSERLEEITNSPAFDLLREQNPQALNKIVLIEGDVAMLELGISKTDQEILKEKVSVVLHSAATINFNEPLKVAVNTNLRSLRELLCLCREIKNLKSVVHISTAFTNWFDMDVKEEIRPTEHNPHEIINLCENFSEEELDKMTPSLLGKHINTYTFTKALAEKLVQNDIGNLPIAIVRPSLVGASISEPKPGWIDSWAAATVFMHLVSKGAFRSNQHVKGHPFDIIPVDKVINMTIAASWKAAMEKSSQVPSNSFPLVFHSTSGATNPITLKQVLTHSRDFGRQNPSNDVVWYPKIRMYSSKLANDLDVLFTHLIPAYLIDFAAKLTGKKPKAVKMQKLISSKYETVSFAAANPYLFRSSSFNNILTQMSSVDQKSFNFDPKSINWKTYLDDYNSGIRKFILKEKPADLVILRAKMQRLKYASYFVTATTAVTCLYVIGKTGKYLLNSKKYQTNKKSSQKIWHKDMPISSGVTMLS